MLIIAGARYKVLRGGVYCFVIARCNYITFIEQSSFINFRRKNAQKQKSGLRSLFARYMLVIKPTRRQNDCRSGSDCGIRLQLYYTIPPQRCQYLFEKVPASPHVPSIFQKLLERLCYRVLRVQILICRIAFSAGEG